MFYDEGYVIDSDHPFKGYEYRKTEETIKKHGAKNIPFTAWSFNQLIGGQHSLLQNLRDVRAIADKYKSDLFSTQLWVKCLSGFIFVR